MVCTFSSFHFGVGSARKKLRDSSGFGGYAGQFVGTQVLGFSAVLVPRNFKARSLVG